jgi:hypothetical protein
VYPIKQSVEYFIFFCSLSGFFRHHNFSHRGNSEPSALHPRSINPLLLPLFILFISFHTLFLPASRSLWTSLFLVIGFCIDCKTNTYSPKMVVLGNAFSTKFYTCTKIIMILYKEYPYFILYMILTFLQNGELTVAVARCPHVHTPLASLILFLTFVLHY